MVEKVKGAIAPSCIHGTLPPAAHMMLLSPFVVSLRMPFLLWECATPHFHRYRKDAEKDQAVIEKSAAIIEGYGSMNAEILRAYSHFWLGSMIGDLPDAKIMTQAMQDIVDAGMAPVAKRVRANYHRLCELSS